VPTDLAAIASPVAAPALVPTATLATLALAHGWSLRYARGPPAA
jgi:hypothetical protein